MSCGSSDILDNWLSSLCSPKLDAPIAKIEYKEHIHELLMNGVVSEYVLSTRPRKVSIE